MRKPSRQTVSSRCFSLLCLLKLGKSEGLDILRVYYGQILGANSYNNLQSAFHVFAKLGIYWYKSRKKRSLHIIKVSVNYFVQLLKI